MARVVIRPCYILIGVSLVGFSLSLALALWWALTHDDISGGFTVGGYIIAATGLLLVVPGYRHSQLCQCWPKDVVRAETAVELLAVGISPPSASEGCNNGSEVL